MGKRKQTDLTLEVLKPTMRVTLRTQWFFDACDVTRELHLAIRDARKSLTRDQERRFQEIEGHFGLLVIELSKRAWR